MRQARLKAPEDHPFAYYHVISRVVNREFALGDDEREQFVEMMRCYANNQSSLKRDRVSERDYWFGWFLLVRVVGFGLARRRA